MNILITGSKGFVGKNLVENLKTIQDGRNHTRPDIEINEIFQYDLESSEEDLDHYCKSADFVFHLAGVNRPQKAEEFKEGNYFFTELLLEKLRQHNSKAPIMISSSIQASLQGRFGISEYGRSKKDGEELVFQYGEESGNRVLVYRFPNLVGKWVRPNYNSAVGTFCHNIANELPITVNDPSVVLELLFIEDLIEEMYDALQGKEHRCEYEGLRPVKTEDGRYCYAPITYEVSLGRIVELLNEYHDFPNNITMKKIPEGSFEKKLYSMYLSYLPKDKVLFDLKMNKDERGSFTEILKMVDHGQFSVNISKPGVVKGQHWHNSKWELFIVVSGHGLIQERKIGSDEILQYEVSGENIQAVHMLPGYTHNIINLSETDNLVTVMWANEIFDSNNPDTFFEPVII